MVRIWKKASSWFEILPNLLLFLTEQLPEIYCKVIKWEALFPTQALERNMFQV